MCLVFGGKVYCVNRIFIFLFKQIDRVLTKLHYYKISITPNIEISKNCTISRSAKIDIVYGGSISIGNGSEILDGVLILTYGGNIKIGSNCSVNPYTIIYGHGNTCIGNNVLIAGGCMIIPANHIYDNKLRDIREQGMSLKGIIIEDNVWIGHGCSILDGVVIKKGSVICAGTVVTKSVDEYSVLAGVPGRVIKVIK
jgi:acetyltransferase-like isoleucine patch superfamily enzyme